MAVNANSYLNPAKIKWTTVKAAVADAYNKSKYKFIIALAGGVTSITQKIWGVVTSIVVALNPVGAIVNAIMAIYSAMQLAFSVKKKMEEMMYEIVGALAS